MIDTFYHDENMTVAFVNTNQTPLKTKHICYYTQKVWDIEARTTRIVLMEIVEHTYPHPQAPDVAIINVLTTRRIGEFSRDGDGSTAILLEAIEQTCRKVYHQSE